MKKTLTNCLDCGKKLKNEIEKMHGLCYSCFARLVSDKGIKVEDSLWLNNTSKKLDMENAVRESWEIANFDLKKTKSLNKVI